MNSIRLPARIPGILLALLISCCAIHAYAIDALPFKDRAEEIRYQNLTRQLRCLVCQNQDLADSDADLARDLRLQVLQLMQSGKSDIQIKQYLTSRYSDYVLYDPPLKPSTWLLWFAPFALCFTGAIAIARIVRRRSQQAFVGMQSTATQSDETQPNVTQSSAIQSDAIRSNNLRSGDDDW